jgi:hypothetical protein
VFPRTPGRYSGKQAVVSLESSQDDGDDDDDDDGDMDDSDHTGTPEDDGSDRIDDSTNPRGYPGDHDSGGGPNEIGEDFFDMSQWITPEFLGFKHPRRYRRKVLGQASCGSRLAAGWQERVNREIDAGSIFKIKSSNDLGEDAWKDSTQTPHTYSHYVTIPRNQSGSAETPGVADRRGKTTRTFVCGTGNCNSEEGPALVDTILVNSEAKFSPTNRCLLSYDEMSPVQPERDDPAGSPWGLYNSADRIPTLRSNTVHCGSPDDSLSCSTPEHCTLDWDSLRRRLIESSMIPQSSSRTGDSDDGSAKSAHRLP